MLARCYSRDCRFYEGGPIGRITYYFVPPTNKVLAFVNRFHPRVLEGPDAINADGTGEIAPSRLTFSNGVNLHPDLLGDHPAGSAADFAGVSTWPGSPPPPADCGDGGAVFAFAVQVSRRSVLGLPVLVGEAFSVDAVFVEASRKEGAGRLRLDVDFQGSLMPPGSPFPVLRWRVNLGGRPSAARAAAAGLVWVPQLEPNLLGYAPMPSPLTLTADLLPTAVPGYPGLCPLKMRIDFSAHVVPATRALLVLKMAGDLTAS